MVIVSANEQMGKMARNVVLRHPNAFDAVAYRKHVERAPETSLGGAMVLSSADESEFDYVELGAVRLLFVDQYAGGTGIADSLSAADYAVPMIMAMIQPIAEINETGHFDLKKSDVLSVHVGGGIAIAFEITGLSGTMGFSPLGVRYELSKRDDLSYAGI